jgi:hypothetical protein
MTLNIKALSKMTLSITKFGENDHYQHFDNYLNDNQHNNNATLRTTKQHATIFSLRIKKFKSQHKFLLSVIDAVCRNEAHYAECRGLGQGTLT